MTFSSTQTPESPPPYNEAIIPPDSTIGGMMVVGAMESESGANSCTTEGGRTNKRLKIAQERTGREERRADKINEQIETLRKLLQGADFPLQSSASNYHVLHSCEKYIQELVMKTHVTSIREATTEYDGSMHTSHESHINGRSLSENRNDVDRRKQHLEESCRISSEQNEMSIFKTNYENAVETADLAIAIASADGQLLRANQNFLKATGYLPAEIEEISLFSLAIPEYRKKIFEAVGESMVSVLSAKRVSDCPKVVLVQSKHGTPLHMNISAVPQHDPDCRQNVPRNLLCCAILPEFTS
jgi:PAS domain S-box-containing protein